MEFFNSKQLSAFCFFVNTCFFIWMILGGEYLLAILPFFAGAICLSNVLR